MAKNPCKYWSTEEPATCAYWNEEHTICEYTTADGTLATLAPYCNMLGTADFLCRQYEPSEDIKANRCILPDPLRHITNRNICHKWVHVVSSGTAAADTEKPLYVYDNGLVPRQTNDYWSFNYINGYNNGDCDTTGTDVTCSGYAPYNMSFGKLLPKDSEDLSDPDTFAVCYTKDDLGYRTPLPYLIFNIRAKLSKCYWWKEQPTDFLIDATTGELNLIDAETKELKAEYNFCEATDDNVKPFWKYQYDEDDGYIAPCNGCKPECPHYTGICWKFCVDDKMSEGSKILAEQILELRYYIRKERWSDLVVSTGSLGEPLIQEIYRKVFDSPDIYSWSGTYTMLISPQNNAASALIQAVRNYFTHFDYFDVYYDSTTLTAGIAEQQQALDFPTLIRDLREPNLRPIIRNIFEQALGTELNTDDLTSATVSGVEISTDTTVSDNVLTAKHNIFEVGALEHKYVTIWGDSFWYNSNIYAINLSDPELISKIPSEIQVGLSEYFSSYDMGKAKSTEFYTKWTTMLDLTIENLLVYMPDQIYSNTLDAEEGGFYIKAKTFFGDNKVIVLDKGSGVWEFDIVEFKKDFCGGIITQTSFAIEGDGKTVATAPHYEKTFAADVNDNGKIDFRFRALKKGTQDGDVAYIYNDNTEGTAVCYREYKVPIFEGDTLTEEYINFFGNKGKALVVLPDNNLLDYTHGEFILDGNLELHMIDENEKLKVVFMEIVEWCNDSLETNQIVIQPKNLDYFSSPCSPQLKIPKLSIKQKRSFGEAPEGNFELITEGGTDDATTLSLNTTTISDIYTLNKFSDSSILLSVVYRSAGGRIKGVARTKPILWVKQPYCRDVEIKYRWQSNYIEYALYPRGLCYGKRENRITGKELLYSYAPPCMDHDKPTRTPSGPMWYPYDQCSSYATYDELSSAHSSDRSIMELFDEEDEDGNKEHGSFDLRMLGTDESYGTEESHAMLWACTCDFFYYNHIKASENLFAGYAYYRGNLDAVAYERCTFDGGEPPKFGDVVRDQLNSYRTMDCVDYYEQQGLSWVTKRKWMPLPQSFTSLDLTGPASDYRINLYTDDYDNPFINQMGLLRVHTIDDVVINETMDEDNRFRFEDVLVPHVSTTIEYPKPKPVQVSGLLLDELNTWYAYKDYPIEPSKAIQWLWREYWQPINRMDSLHEDVLTEEDTYTKYSPPYKNAYGQHAFLDITYPDYIYDYKQGEHRTVCTEGEHTITIVPSILVDELSLEDNYFLIQLDYGPPRLFDIEGNWSEIPTEGWWPLKSDTIEFPGHTSADINLAQDTYQICAIDSTSWNQEVTLFEAGTFEADNEADLITKAEEEDRKYTMYDSLGDSSDYYYNRGLVVDIISNLLDLLPRYTMVLEASQYNWRLSIPSETPIYDSAEPGEYYPAQRLPDLTYTIPGKTGLDLDLDFIPATSGGYFNRFIVKIDITYTFGLEEVDELGLDVLYHIPNLEIYRRENLVSTLIHSEEGEVATEDSGVYRNKVVTYYIPFTHLDMRRYYRYLDFKFDFIIPDEDPENPNYPDTYTHKINIVSIVLHDSKFVMAYETFDTTERKYLASYGQYADMPIHGTDTTGNLLHPPYDELSTPTQRDNITGILGAPNSADEYTTMHKTAGRLLKPCTVDRTRVPGNNVYEFEAEQKRIFDDAMDQGSTTFTATSITPPGLTERLDLLGLRFPTWTCTFKNTMNLKLADVIQQSPYNACGHEWSSTTDNPREEWGCYPKRTYTDNLFEYQYINPCTRVSFGAYDWMQSQYYAAINRLTIGGGWFSDGSGAVITFYTGGESTIDEGSLTNLYIP